MSTSIQSAAISNHKEPGGSVDHAIRAGERCIEQAGIDRNEIGLLINIGIYRDENIAEPAMAALIQKGLRLNPDPINNISANSTFSFDLVNGSCGFLYAAQVADSFIRSGEKKLIMIVSSDVHPSRKKSDTFPYTHIGSAVLLGKSEREDSGFKSFMFQTSKKGCAGLMGFTDYLAHGPEGRNNVTINTTPNYIERLENLAIRSIKKRIRTGEIDLSELRLIITSQPIPGFEKRISRAIGLDDGLTISVHEDFGKTNTSDLSIGYYAALKKGILKSGDKILFIGASTGITIALSVYTV
jgi:3-oxoacyl-[acyl-carrier-protein] synthase III